jgi:porphobilinogen deaminase
MVNFRGAAAVSVFARDDVWIRHRKVIPDLLVQRHVKTENSLLHGLRAACSLVLSVISFYRHQYLQTRLSVFQVAARTLLRTLHVVAQDLEHASRLAGQRSADSCEPLRLVGYLVISTL